MKVVSALAEKQQIDSVLLREKFSALARRWKQERGPITSIERISVHPAYQAIIGMGPDVLPFILEDLERQPEHWFWALRAITQADPVPAESAGKMKEMAAAWLAWAKSVGLTWQ